MLSIKGLWIVVFLFFLSLGAWGQEKFRYTIKGSVYDRTYDGITVYLAKDGTYEKDTRKDSTKIRHGKFKFRGKRSEWPHMYHISLSDKQWINVCLEAGIIKVEFEKETKKISGTPINDLLYNDFIMPSYQVRFITESLRKKREEAIEMGQWTTKDEAEYTQKLPMKELTKLQIGKLHFVKTYADYPVAEWFVYEMMINPRPDKELPDILSRLPEDSRKRLDHRLEKYRQELAEFIKKEKKKNIRDFVPDSVEVGKQFINVRGVTIQGDTVGIDTFIKNKKLYLLDFWASWCKPCMQAMSEISALYEEYRGKGLEIIGLSSDNQIGAWTKAIENKRMTWPQLRVCKDKNKDALDVYGIFFIPYTILIDEKGRVIARNLKGTKLIEKVAEILD